MADLKRKRPGSKVRSRCRDRACARAGDNRCSGRLVTTDGHVQARIIRYVIWRSGNKVPVIANVPGL